MYVYKKKIKKTFTTHANNTVLYVSVASIGRLEI